MSRKGIVTSIAVSLILIASSAISTAGCDDTNCHEDEGCSEGQGGGGSSSSSSSGSGSNDAGVD